MSAKQNNGSIREELRSVQFSPYGEIFGKFKELSEKYGGLSTDSLVSAFGSVIGGGYSRNNPYIQNRRVKAISSLPVDYSKDDVAELIRNPDNNELALRQVMHGLEYTAYPLFHMRKVYQDLLTYHNYIAPQFIDKEQAKKDDFWREWRLLEKIREKLDLKANAHMIAGQAIQEGKVFYYPRISVDKAHNRVNHAFMQQIPSDWVKIVGFNNISKYTVSFNMMYFLMPGTDPLQFGDLFIPYMDDFADVLCRPEEGIGKSVVFASSPKIDLPKFNAKQMVGQIAGNPEVYCQNGKWFYWVTLPVDKVFTFEIDDTGRNAVSPFTGLFLSMIQLATYEQVQLEIVQNPLISLVTGEIPYLDNKDVTASDGYKLSNAGRKLFEALWYEMLSANNTSGIGLFMAPLENMKLHQLAEAPNAMEIAGNGYSYAISKAGLSGIIPTAEDPRAGLAQISLEIESKFAQGIYRDFERMMRAVFDTLNLKYEWKFEMFGDLATDKERLDNCRQSMTLGLLPETIVYNAMNDRCLLDDIAISDAILESKVMDKRLPLVSSYSAKQEKSGLPPQAKHDMNPGGRPSAEGKATTDGQENDVDSLGA